MPDDEFSEYLKQRIEDAFGLNELTPEERAYWDAYDRFMEAVHREQEASAARVLGNAKAIAAWISENPSVLNEILPGAGATMAEHGLRFVWGAT